VCREGNQRHRRDPGSRVRLGAAVVAAAIVLTTAACSGGPGTSPASTNQTSSSQASVTLTVYAAASLKAVLAKVKEAYEATHPGTTLTITTDSSAAIETKIEQAAPADVFLSADTSNPQKLVDEGLASGALVKFARNELTVIVPSANPATIASPVDLAKPGVKIVAAEDSAPISKYAMQLVDNLAKQAGYPADFATAYAANVVSREDNVAAVVTKVELGEGDAGIVYVTDARASGKVKTIGVPDAANVPVTYGTVVVKASTAGSSADALLRWLTGTDGQAIFASFGFLPPT
jgi:molybdate transport system substrate-binding protein